jgi:hypothetical protein
MKIKKTAFSTLVLELFFPSIADCRKLKIQKKYKNRLPLVYTHKTYTQAAYTVTKCILYRMYTEHTVYSRIFSIWCLKHYKKGSHWNIFYGGRS